MALADSHRTLSLMLERRIVWYNALSVIVTLSADKIKALAIDGQRFAMRLAES
jgi:hypothetical protein